MSNSLTGFQIVASSGMLTGAGISVPNISTYLTTYNAFPPVANFQTIYYNTANVSANNVSILQSLGSNTFPQMFGQCPTEFSVGLGYGPVFNKIPNRISKWFGNVNSSSIFLQSLAQAQGYATQAASLINSAASTQWVNGPSNSITGGLTLISGNNQKALTIVGTAFKQLGTLMLMSAPLSGFSNAGCFKQLLDSGNDTIGNLHINFFGKTIVDPVTGKTYIINSDLFDYIIASPVGRTEDDEFKIVALNPLDALVGQVANNALISTNDLDAVVTYFGINGSSAVSINKWTDCLNVSLMLGSQATETISTNLNITKLEAYDLIKVITNSVSGLANLNSIVELGTTMATMTVLPNSNVSAMMTPITQNNYSNLQLLVGVGTGANANPTVADVLGRTNINAALSNVIIGLNTISNTQLWSNISSDTGNLANALVNGISSNVFLSNGTSYNDINALSSNAALLINSESLTLANTITNVSLFSNYNGLVETHNNSVLLTQRININVSSFSNNNIILLSFPQQLASMATENVETSGLDVLIPLLDTTAITGQALDAVVIEAINNKKLISSGLQSTSTIANSTVLTSTQTGNSVLGGGIIIGGGGNNGNTSNISSEAIQLAIALSIAL